MQQYKTLNDAAEVHPSLTALKLGSTEIWYQRVNLIHFDSNEVKLRELPRTHVKLGEIASTDLEEIFRCLQGEIWSPNGEAMLVLGKSGAGMVHTSMSVGDVVVRPDGSTFVVSGVGFLRIYGESEFLLRRNSADELTYAVISVTADTLNPALIMGKISEAITKWVETSDQGRGVWYDGFDIGDLADYEDSPKLKLQLMEQGVKALHITIHCHEQRECGPYTYDTPLGYNVV